MDGFLVTSTCMVNVVTLDGDSKVGKDMWDEVTVK